MRPEDVPTDWVEKAAREITDYLHRKGDWIPPQHRQIARNTLAAVLPDVKRQSHREGYETARGDMVSGAFIGGPTYEALRDSFTGRQIQAQALRDYATTWADAGDYDPWDESEIRRDVLEHADRLTATTDSPNEGTNA